MSAPYPERLYYADSYLTRFETHVAARLTWEGSPAVILESTAFYPASGGQPSDRGTLCDVPVVGVEVREVDGAIVHVLAQNLPVVDRVVGQVDWVRRFDHMQQHSGQHLLSAACEQMLEAETVSFHLGVELCTIDLSVARLPAEAMEPVESKVNQVIWQDRRVTMRFVEASVLSALPLRRSPKVDGPVRVVEVEAEVEGPPFDINPCGGTHVARTGEIGLLKVLRLDYRGEETRVEFLCGGRALRDYGLKNRTALQLAADLTVGHWELEEAVARLQRELKGARGELRAARQRAVKEEAARLAQAASVSGACRIVRAVWHGRDAAELRALARAVAEKPSLVALLASVGEPTHVCVACSEGVESDAAAILRAVCEPLGGKGGGQPHLAQGSVPSTDRERLERVLDDVVSGLGSRTADP